MEIKYCFDDISLVPGKMTHINSRQNCNPYNKDGKLPIFCAPMSCVTNDKNYEIFDKNKLIPILPRTVSYNTRLKYILDGKWVAVSEAEFKKLFIEHNVDDIEQTYRICLDVANGHRYDLYEMVKEAKAHTKDSKYKLEVMIGNVANPDIIYEILSEFLGVIDYIRLSIGTGNVCTTSTQTGIHYPMASLLIETHKCMMETARNLAMFKYKVKPSDIYDKLPKIVCDGGIKSYSDIIKALALGADYVMLGSQLASLEESAAETVDMEIKGEFIPHKEYYGMSTDIAQELINNALECPKKDFIPKVTEGTIKYLPIRKNITEWTNELTSYLKSSMSYTDSDTLDKFKDTQFILLSNAAQQRINKP